MKRKRFLYIISRSTWGPVLAHLRQIYVSKIRPIIFYACASWALVSYDRRPRWGLTLENLKKLQNLQRDCLVQISGAIVKTPRQMLEKELNIDTVRAFMVRMVLSQRARFLCGSGEALFTKTYLPVATEEDNPYDDLDLHAAGLIKRTKAYLTKTRGEEVAAQAWLHPRTRNKAINACAKREAAEQNAEEWDDYRRRRAQRHEDLPFVVREDWDPQSLRSYRGLTRAQSTMLLQCRTEVIGLGSMLFDRRVSYSPALGPCLECRMLSDDPF